MWQMDTVDTVDAVYAVDTEDTEDTVDTVESSVDTLDSVCVASDLMRLIVSEKVIVPYTLLCHLVLSSFAERLWRQSRKVFLQ